MMISERFNTKFRLFGGNGSSGSGGGAGSPDTTTSTTTNTNTSTGPKSSKDQQRVEELTNYYQEQLRNGTMSQSTANGLIKKLEGTKQQNNGVYTQDGLEYLALKNALAETSKDAMAGDPRYQSNPSSSNSNTKVTTTAPNYHPQPSQTNDSSSSKSNNVEFNFPNPSSMSDDELSKYLKQLQKERESDTGKMFASIYDNAIKRANEEYERRNKLTQTPNTSLSDNSMRQKTNSSAQAAAAAEQAGRAQAAAAYAAAKKQAEEMAKAKEQQKATAPLPGNNTSTQQATNTPVNNTPEEVEQSEPVKEGKTYIPHEIAYTVNGENGNRFNRQAQTSSMDEINNAFKNLYLIGSGNYYNPNGSANQNLYGMNQQSVQPNVQNNNTTQQV